MHQQSTRQLQECVTALPIADVLRAAESFFSHQGGVYAAFAEHRGPTHVVLRGQGNEEVAIAARETPAGVAVTASSYLFDQQVARFLQSLPPAPVMPESPDAAPALAAGEATA